MNRFILLDSAPLGMVTNPNASKQNLACANWLKNLLAQGDFVFIPEIADYEIRRELLRANKIQGLKRLDLLKTNLDYLPITTEIMLKAAEFWATVRKQGKPTAPDFALDGDVILASQAFSLENVSDVVIIATSNVKHLSLFVNAQEWEKV
ncbi:MAG: nucleic acid-binding protein [Aridibacter sp.]